MLLVVQEHCRATSDIRSDIAIVGFQGRLTRVMIYYDVAIQIAVGKDIVTGAGLSVDQRIAIVFQVTDMFFV